jgi:hypothetical protein
MNLVFRIYPPKPGLRSQSNSLPALIMVCNGSDIFDFHNICVRSSWSAILPASFVIVLCLLALVPVPESAQKLLEIVKSPFKSYISLPEAEALDAKAAAGDVADDDEDDGQSVVPTPVPLWRTLLLSWVALVEALVWLGVSSFRLVDTPSDPWNIISPFLISCTWLYASARPVFTPMVTPPKDLFVLYVIHLASAILLFGGMIFDYNAVDLPLPHTSVVFAFLTNLVAIGILLAVIINMPLALPSKLVRKEDIVTYAFFTHATFILTQWGLSRANRFPQKTIQRYSIG